MLIYGAGGHAKVVLSILVACEESVNALFDDNWQNMAQTSQLIPRGYHPLFMPTEKLILAIGNNHDRRQTAEKVGHAFGNAVHPTAIVDASVQTESGIVIVHNAVIQAGCRIGNHVIVNTVAIVDHDCMLADFVHVGPGATLCGGVCVGECTLIGAGSVVLPGVHIGRECVIGAGSVVLSDVPDFSKVAGNPARSI